MFVLLLIFVWCTFQLKRKRNLSWKQVIASIYFYFVLFKVFRIKILPVLQKTGLSTVRKGVAKEIEECDLLALLNIEIREIEGKGRFVLIVEIRRIEEKEKAYL